MLYIYFLCVNRFSRNREDGRGVVLGRPRSYRSGLQFHDQHELLPAGPQYGPACAFKNAQNRLRGKRAHDCQRGPQPVPSFSRCLSCVQVSSTSRGGGVRQVSCRPRADGRQCCGGHVQHSFSENSPPFFLLPSTLSNRALPHTNTVQLPFRIDSHSDEVIGTSFHMHAAIRTGKHW
jgi:hypothetical protein